MTIPKNVTDALNGMYGFAATHPAFSIAGLNTVNQYIAAQDALLANHAVMMKRKPVKVDHLKPVVTTNLVGTCVCVSMQDEDGRIAEVLWEAPKPNDNRPMSKADIVTLLQLAVDQMGTINDLLRKINNIQNYDRAPETSRGQSAVKFLLDNGYTWKNNQWKHSII